MKLFLSLLFVLSMTFFVVNFSNTNVSTETKSVNSDCDSMDYSNLESLFFLAKMNIIYIGLDNPLKIRPLKSPSDSIEITSKEIEIIKKENGFYILRANAPGNGNLLIKIGDFQENYVVQIKRMPDPIARLGSRGSGTKMRIDEFYTQNRIIAWIDNFFEINGTCKVISFSMTQIKKDGSQKTVKNEGGRFGEKALELQKSAESGDIYLFENIKSQCPGDRFIDEKLGRRLNDLIIRIE